MRKEIVLPPHLYDRIKASAGEHGGIGAGCLFTGRMVGDDYAGVPLCAHGHAWGTCTRYNRSAEHEANRFNEPELGQFLSWSENDSILLNVAKVSNEDRVPFERWCELLNVKRGSEPPRDDLLIKRLEKSVEMTQREPINA